MQFIDQARVVVRAGRGGDGIVAFRREKYVPAGGPAGGDGGRGGHVLLRADANLQTLLDFKYKRIFQAIDGRRGGPNRCAGAGGDDLVIRVPCGTEVRDCRTGILLGDLTEPGQELMVAAGGRGGLGNAHYLSNRNRAPEKATEGKDGEEWMLQLELKLLAEVGIIGLPNAGKSTLISVLSAARPKIADYPFTTLVPNLGVVRRPSGDGTVFADIPGLIEGAAQGAGLGHDFLRHIERTRLLIHLVDAGSEDWLADVAVVEGELQAYDHGLASRPRLLVLNKIELLDAADLATVMGQLREHGRGVGVLATLGISAATGDGLERLKAVVWAELEAATAAAEALHPITELEAVSRPRERLPREVAPSVEPRSGGVPDGSGAVLPESHSGIGGA
ncbi:MAG: GTPase ObgE [Cyanobium sp.]